ncbi:RNA polymerase sigma factor [Candidatus Poribacteria bacterium]|nr:RNA polymerase sigma factor [Candidatus Poribacteria bacterium]
MLKGSFAVPLLEVDAEAASMRGVAGPASRSAGASGTEAVDDEMWWLASLQNGHEEGLRWLLRQYGTWIYSKAYRMLGNHEDAEEAWQDIFMRVWQKIELWNPERGSFQSWLNQIAKNAIIDVFRKKNRLREVLQYGEDDAVEEMLNRFRDESPLPDELLEAQEIRELIQQALNQMTKKNHRVAWVLRHLEGMSIAEISEALNQKENTVKVWIFRATRELKQILVRRGFEYQVSEPEGFDEDERAL